MIDHVRTVRDERTLVKHVDYVRAKYDYTAMPESKRTGLALLELKGRSGLTLAKIAKAAGYRGRSSVQAYFNADYTGQISPSTAMAFASVFEGKGTPPIRRDEVISLAGFEANAIPFNMEGASSERMRPDLPIYGTALGASRQYEGEAIEQTMLNNGEIIGYAKRPTILDGRADAYGLYVQGSSMYPVHAEGAILLAERKKPPRVGDDVVVYIRFNGEQDQSDNGELVRCVLVKRLVRRTASYVELEQFSPPLTFKIDAQEIVRIDRVLTLADLLS